MCSVAGGPVRFLSDHDQTDAASFVECHPYEGDSIGVSWFLFKVAEWVLSHVP